MTTDTDAIVEQLRDLADEIEGDEKGSDSDVLNRIFKNSSDRVFKYRNGYPAVEVGFGFASTGEMRATREAGFTVYRVRGGPNDSRTDTDNPVIIFYPRD